MRVWFVGFFGRPHVIYTALCQDQGYRAILFALSDRFES